MVSIVVTLSRQIIDIDENVFSELLENSVAHTYTDYERTLNTSSIAYSDLVDLARKGDIPYSLFFAPLPFVKTQIKMKTDTLLRGLSKDTFSVNSRESVDLRDIELIVKDLLRKQQLLKKDDDSLTKNPIVGLLRKPGKSIDDDAKKLPSALGLTRDAIRTARTKEKALDTIISRLEANQILVSQSVKNFMPQQLKVKFSGLTIKDAKVPYIFLKGGDQGDYQEPAGRRIFTLVLMCVLVARKIFAPITYDGSNMNSGTNREYGIIESMLMPVSEFSQLQISSLADVKAVADYFKVTPSAVAVRARHLGVITDVDAGLYLEQLQQDYSTREESHHFNPIKPVNAIRKYNGREFSRRMLAAYDRQLLPPSEFCRAVCLNHIKPSQIEDFRMALR